MKHLTIQLMAIVMMALSITHSVAQSPQCNPDAYQAYLTQSAAEAKRAWTDVVATTKSEIKHSPSEDLRFKLALAQFGLLNATMRSRNETLFNEHIEATVSNLETITGQHAAEAQALLGAAYGLQLAYAPAKGMYLGPKSSALLDKAIKKDRQSALVWKLYGNSKLHTPDAYGGDVGEAIEAYEKAIALYEAAPANARTNWFFIDTMAFLGQAYLKIGQKDKAIAMYQKALETEPDFTWVKYSLLPLAQNGTK